MARVAYEYVAYRGYNKMQSEVFLELLGKAVRFIRSFRSLRLLGWRKIQVFRCPKSCIMIQRHRTRPMLRSWSLKRWLYLAAKYSDASNHLKRLAI